MPPIPKTPISTNLDLLRAIAVLCVFANHFLDPFGIKTDSLGHIGVIMFFIHTSFVLMASLQRMEVSTQSRRGLFEAFWLRRIFRIYPLAILFIVAAVIFRVPPFPGMAYAWIGVKGFFANLALVQNLTYSPDVLSPLWSLPLEIQMYAMLPFVYVFFRPSKGYHLAIFWIFMVVLALVLPRVNLRLDVFAFAPCFGSGIVAFYLLRNRPQTRQRLPSWLWPVGIIAAIVLFGPMGTISWRHKLYSAWALSLALGLLYVNVREGPSNFVHGICHWIAEHSYGIYLSHIVFIWLAFYPMAAAPVWLRVLVFVTATIGVPAILYRTVEHPLVLVGGHISRRVLHPHVQVLKETVGPAPDPSRVL
jgi:peptidoglycan/LPS O-acetylase OafA/YrhL